MPRQESPPPRYEQPQPRYEPQSLVLRHPVHEAGYAQEPSRHPARRAFKIFFLILLLVLTPIVAGYLSFYLNTGHWPAPVDRWFPSP
jgi:hypothetical protein